MEHPLVHPMVSPQVQLEKDLLEYQRQLYKQKQISPALLVALVGIPIAADSCEHPRGSSQAGHSWQKK